jgi:putative ABC transport system permease protein
LLIRHPGVTVKYAPFLIKNLLRNRRRAILTVSSIAASLFVFSALMSAPAVVRRILAQESSSLRIVTHNKAGIFYSLPANYKRRIAMTPHVIAVSGEDIFGGVYRDPAEQLPAVAVDPDAIDDMWPEWMVSRATLADFLKSRSACLIGRHTARRYGWRVGDRIVIKGLIMPIQVTLDIVGVLPGSGAPEDAIVFRLDYLDDLMGHPNRINFFWVKVDSSESIPIVIGALDEMFENSIASTESESEISFIGQFLAAYRSFLKLSEILGVIVIVSMGLVAANTAAMSIRERRREVAVIRSMGFTSNAVLAMLLGESVILSTVGGLIGCVTAYLVLKFGLPAFNINTIPMLPRLIVYGTGAAATMGIVCAIIPALSTARGNIVESLRKI